MGGPVRMVGVPSCSGFDCLLFVVAVGVFSLVARCLRESLPPSAELEVRVAALGPGAALLAAVWPALRLDQAMDELALISSLAAGALAGLALLHAGVRRVAHNAHNLRYVK